VGGGALPLAEIESYACALEEELAARLRTGEPPVVGILRDGKLLLDCRTISEGEVAEVAAAVAAARARA
jgi:L-seryl-tRNA(Ser) seleniumtransferase